MINCSGVEAVFSTKEIALITILSALGGAISVQVGWAGNLLRAVPGIPFGTPQLLSGIHVLWIILAGLLVRQRGAALITGFVKGLVELSLFSWHGATILPISVVEGIVAEAAFLVLGRRSGFSTYLTGGFSASSNVLVMWFLVFPTLPWYVVAVCIYLVFINNLETGLKW